MDPKDQRLHEIRDWPIQTLYTNGECINVIQQFHINFDMKIQEIQQK